MSTARNSPISDKADGSQPRNIRLSKKVAGMLGRRAVGSENVDDEDGDGMDKNMSIVLTLARSYEAASDRIYNTNPVN